ncbi:hypothetical protein [Parvularcula lutaonensis]|uniref:Uncharacterized protein n=1 Tax=Parvularcula lutaonensis TaxID=491923 RepID=A0ABV7MFW3_9PROT|nr:hypothetical protein [Parvularcula lutaonensis]GGY54338.1 hypothetical protein GCM10007148_24890 [Parvularcula lutaonensis]
MAIFHFAFAAIAAAVTAAQGAPTADEILDAYNHHDRMEAAALAHIAAAPSSCAIQAEVDTSGGPTSSSIDARRKLVAAKAEIEALRPISSVRMIAPEAIEADKRGMLERHEELLRQTTGWDQRKRKRQNGIDTEVNRLLSEMWFNAIYARRQNLKLLMDDSALKLQNHHAVFASTAFGVIGRKEKGGSFVYIPTAEDMEFTTSTMLRYLDELRKGVRERELLLSQLNDEERAVLGQALKSQIAAHRSFIAGEEEAYALAKKLADDIAALIDQPYDRDLYQQLCLQAENIFWSASADRAASYRAVRDADVKVFRIVDEKFTRSGRLK